MSPVTHGWAAARAYCGVLFRLLQRCRDMRPSTRHFHTLEIFSNVPILMQMTCMGRLGHVASGVPGATPLMHGACGALDQKWRSLCKIHFAYTQYKGQKLQETVTSLQITNIMLGFRSFGPLVAKFCLLKCPKACKDFSPPPKAGGKTSPNFNRVPFAGISSESTWVCFSMQRRIMSSRAKCRALQQRCHDRAVGDGATHLAEPTVARTHCQ